MNTVQIRYVDDTGGPYVFVRVNGAEVGSLPLNPGGPIRPAEVGGILAQVARALGAEVQREHDDKL